MAGVAITCMYGEAATVHAEFSVASAAGIRRYDGRTMLHQKDGFGPAQVIRQ